MRVSESMERCIVERGLAGPRTPVLLMVSGGSDSTALAYLAADLHARGALGLLGILHVNHRLRGADADADEEADDFGDVDDTDGSDAGDEE